MPKVKYEIEITIGGVIQIITTVGTMAELIVRMIDVDTDEIIDRKQLVDDFDNEIKFP